MLVTWLGIVQTERRATISATLDPLLDLQLVVLVLEEMLLTKKWR